MKKFILFLILVTGTFTCVNAGYIDEEAGVGPLHYFIDTLTFKNSASKEIDYLLTLSASRANTADGSIGGGGTIYYNIVEPLTLSFNYNYNGSRTYALYQAVTETSVTIKGVATAVKASVNVPIILTTNTFKGGLSYDLPFLEDYIPSVDYYLSRNPEKLITKANITFTGPLGYSGTINDTFYDKSFNNTINDLSINSGLPLDFYTWLGATKDSYDFNAQKVVDATGTSLNTNKASQTLKSAIQFLNGTIYTGLSKKMWDLTLTFTYTYDSYFFSYNTASNDFSHDFALSAMYSFAMKETFKSIDAGLKFEVLRAHYTDNTYLNSGYIYANITFNLL